MIAPLAVMALVAIVIVFRGLRRKPDGSANTESSTSTPFGGGGFSG